MEPKIKALFNEDILELAKTLYQMDENSLKLLGGFESFVYEYTCKSKPYILKITHQSHRTKDQIDSEFDFVNYLYHHGGSVSKPVYNRHGNFTHRYPLDSGYFTLSSTEKALGNRPTDVLVNLTLQQKYGQTIGLFHKLTMTYKPSFNIDQRFTWYEDPLILEAKSYLDDNDAFVYEKLEQVISDIKRILETPDNYGLIHTDIHRSNFLVDENHNLTVFDFDDASYHYFMSDIAIAIFYSLFFHPDKDSISTDFMIHLLKGYRLEHTFTKDAFLSLELFFRLRMIILYIALKRSTSPLDPFTAKYNALYLDSIKHHKPFLNVSYSDIYEKL